MSEDTDIYEVFFWWLKTTAMALGVLITLNSRFVNVRISAVLLAFKTITPLVKVEGEFVNRGGLLEELKGALTIPDQSTVLLYGKRGGGKTSLIEHALKGRRGVIRISISKTRSHDDAQAELIDKLSRKLHLRQADQSEEFIHDVFSLCAWYPFDPFVYFSRCWPFNKWFPDRDITFWPEPIVVITLSAACEGEVLKGVATLAKELAYDSRHTKRPRMLIDIAGSRAAIQTGGSLESSRVIGIHVGDFLEEEASQYVFERIPESFQDNLRKKELAASVAEKLDCHVSALQKFCMELKKRKITDKDAFAVFLNAVFADEKSRALTAWSTFFENLEERVGVPVPSQNMENIARMLFQGPQEYQKITDELKIRDAKSSVRRRDLAEANAGSDYIHPLAIHPFRTTVSLSGKAIKEALEEKYVPRGPHLKTIKQKSRQ